MPDSPPPVSAPPVQAAERLRPASYVLPALVLVLGVLAAAIAADTLRQRIRTATSERFQALITVQEQQLQARFNAYLQILRGAQGFWLGSADAGQERWKRYQSALQLERDFPGIQAVGYLDALNPDPLGDLRAFGYDLTSEPMRRAAMERARDTGEPALSARIRMIEKTGTRVQQGFIVYVPLYSGTPANAAERRAQIRGYVYGPFRAGDFMRNVLANRGLYVQYSIYDGDAAEEGALMFESQRPLPAPPGQGEIVSHLELAGHPWTVVSRPGPLLNTGADRTAALLVGGGGAVVALLLCALMLAIARTRDAAQQLALRMTADLREREAELQKLSARLTQSNDDLQQFVYAASHDLKEPLRTIASSLGLVTHRHAAALDDNAREFLGYATEGAQHLSSLIDNLLDYSRIQTQPAPLEPVRLDEVLDRALQDLGARLTESEARIERDPLPVVLANRDQVLRVFENLIGNAVKYSRGQPVAPRVHIGAWRDGPRWVITVQDNGIGIAKEYHARIFEMFKRLHTRSEYEGSGVGLALCKRIVQRHGGDIWVESHPGKGATFSFSLLASTLSEPELRSPRTPRP